MTEARIKVVFIKSYKVRSLKYAVGTYEQMRSDKAKDLISRKIVKEYKGEWPPKGKVKMKLKDLNENGKNNG